MSKRAHITLSGQDLLLDAAGALYWPLHELLVVSDLHLEKGSALARTGSLLPPFDSRDSLRRLLLILNEYRPKNLVFLGDSLHDAESFTRLGNNERILLEQIEERTQCFWIEGNHDAAFFSSQEYRGVTHLSIDPLTFAHQPEAKLSPPQIVGHYHPKASANMGGNFVRGRCFIHSDEFLIMPAFGTYTGGLDIDNQAIAKLFERAKPAVHLIYRENIFRLK